MDATNADDRPRRFSAPALFGLVLAGILLIQVAWVLAVPTFRGIDEYDHVYKAEAVARGQWLSREPAENGRGSLVVINERTIRDATVVCEWLKYPLPDNCHPAEKYGSGLASAATAAGMYHPAYYAIVGNAARHWAGDPAVYVMRVVTALMCALLLAWGASLLALWARTGWPLVAYLAGLTPVCIYSTAIVAPNGLHYAGAALVWMASIAFHRAPEHAPKCALALAVGGTTFVSMHPSGPMWLALMAGAVLLLRPTGEWWALLRDRLLLWSVAVATVVIATLASATWTRLSGANKLGPSDSKWVTGPDPQQFVAEHAKWMLQAIGAFPTRTEPAPHLTYVSWGLLLLVLVWLLLRRLTLREGMSLALLCAGLVLVPTLLTLASYTSEGYSWQGRYSLPLWFGVTALAALALDRGKDLGPRALLTFLTLMAAGTTTSTVVVALRDMSYPIPPPAAGEFPGGILLVALLSLAGTLMPSLAYRHSSKGLVRVAQPATSRV